MIQGYIRTLAFGLGLLTGNLFFLLIEMLINHDVHNRILPFPFSFLILNGIIVCMGFASEVSYCKSQYPALPETTRPLICIFVTTLMIPISMLAIISFPHERLVLDFVIIFFILTTMCQPIYTFLGQQFYRYWKIERKKTKQ